MKRIIEDITQRRQRTIARERHPGRFQLSMLPNLEVLTLTNVPSTSRGQGLIDSLALFIHECAEEKEFGRLGRFGIALKERLLCKEAYQQYTKTKCLVLEISPTSDPIDPPHSPGEQTHSFTKSYTEDPDSEMSMEASESNPSFFREDDSGLLVSEGKIDTPAIGDNGLIHMGSPTANGHLVDVIQELATFRREKRMGYDAAVRMGKSKLDTVLFGIWRGEVKVVKGFLSV